MFSGLIEDVYIFPVSISYEKIPDGNFNDEQMVRISGSLVQLRKFFEGE